MVVTQGIERLLMIFMGRICERFQFLGITPRSARVLGRSHSSSFDETCADSDDAGRLFRSDPGHHSEKFPATLAGVRSLIVGPIFSAE